MQLKRKRKEKKEKISCAVEKREDEMIKMKNVRNIEIRRKETMSHTKRIIGIS